MRSEDWYFVFWFFCGGAAALIAAKRRYNILLWGILGCLFGIVAVFVILCLPVTNLSVFQRYAEGEKQIPQTNPATETVCRECNLVIPKLARYCPYCGSDP
jgi:hypothetical protein